MRNPVRAACLAIIVVAAAALPPLSASAVAARPEPCVTLAQPVDPGSVVTFVVPMQEVGGAGATIQYEPAPGFRSLGVLVGGSSAVVSASLAGRLPAGPTTAGRLVAMRGGARVATRCMSVVVRRRAMLEIGQVPASLAVHPQRAVRMGVWVRNRGNAPDTVVVGFRAPAGIRVTADPSERVVIPLGDSVRVWMRLSVTGEQREVGVPSLGVEVRGATRAVFSVPLSVLPARTLSVPADVFAGSAWSPVSGEARLAYAVSTGLRAGGVAFSLQARSPSAPLFYAPGFSSLYTSPVFLVQAVAPSWSAAAGDIPLRYDRLTGEASAGRGAALHVAAGAFRFGGAVARDRSLFGGMAGQEDLRADAGVDWARNGLSLGLRGTVSRSDSLARTPALAISSGWRRGGHSAAADVGYFPQPGRVGGMAEYGYTSPTTMASALVRHMGEAAPLGRPSRDARLSVSRALGSGWRGYLSASDLVVERSEGGGEFGARTLRVGGRKAFMPGFGVGAHVGAHLHRGAVSGSSSGVLAGGAADLSRGRFRAELGADAAAGDSGVFLAQMRGGVRWANAGESAYLSVVRTQFAPEGSNPLFLDLLVNSTLGDWTAEGQVSRNLVWSRQEGEVYSLTRASIGRALSPRTTATIGIEHLPYAGWRMAIGVRQRIGVPLPFVSLSRPGTVFYDRDGDGVQGPGEAGIEGAVVRGGEAMAMTDRRGRFSPLDAGVGLTVDATSLPSGWVHLSGSGTSRALPAVQPSQIDIRVVLLDPGRPVSGEAPFANLRVWLEDARGERRDAVVSDSGVAQFGGLRAGTYVATVQARQTTRTATVELPGGARVERVVEFPDLRRAVVFAAPLPALEAPATRSRDVCFTFRFATARSALRPGEMAAFGPGAAMLECLPRSEPVCVVGRADVTGTPAGNLVLALRRAESVRDFLVRVGYEAHRIAVVTLGDTALLAPGNSPAANRQNRSARVFSSTTCPP